MPLFALKGQSGGIGAISSLTVSSLLVESSEIGLGNGEYISSIGGQLFYYNGSVLEPISALSSISSIEAWSEYPAISTLNLAGENLVGGNVMAGSFLSTTQAEISSISATEINVPIVSFSTMTGDAAAISTIGANYIVTDFIGGTGATFSTLTTSSFGADAAAISTIQADSAVVTEQLTASSIGADSLRVSSIVTDDISTFTLTVISTISAISSISSIVISAEELLNISSINGQPISFYEPGSVSTVSTFQQLGTSSLTTSTINGFVPDNVANWAQYAANGQVDLGNNTLYSGGNSADDVKIVAERYISHKAEKVYINADEGSFDVLNNSLIQLSTTNGFRGEIDIIANEGNALGGKITLTANGGDIGGLLYGGVIELTANTGGGFIPSPAFTSAIRLSAASILEYSGATNSIGSVAGYGFYHGDAGLNLTAGVPPLAPNDPLTVYLYGTNGVLVYSPMYVYGPIRPYSDLTNNPQDLYIEDWSNGLSRGYIQLRGVSTMGFKGGDTAIVGVNTIQFSTVGGALQNVSSINGQPISFYEPGGVSTLSTFTDLFTSSLAASSIQSIDITADALLNISSINGLPIGELINVSSISSLNEWSYFPAISTIDAAGNDIKSIGNLFASVGGGMDIVADSGIVMRTNAGAGAQLTAGETFLSSLTVANKVGFDVNTPSTLTLKVASGTDNANLAANNVNATISTSFIQGTATDMFGITGFNDGLNIKASSISLTSTPLVVFPGFLNASTCAFFQANIRDVFASTVTTSTLSVTNAFTTPSISTGAIVGTGASVSSLSFFQQGPYGLSSLIGLSTTGAPTGTSTLMTINTDLSVGLNDIFCGQVRIFPGLGTGNTTAEIVMTGPDSYVQTMDRSAADITFRTRSGGNPAVSTGYFIDTFHNKPFFSTLNAASTAMMAYYPSTNANTIGISTLALLPAPLPLQMFGVSTFQVSPFDITLPRNYTATNYAIQITPMSNTVQPGHASTVSVSSFQVHAGGGASIGVPFFWQTIGMNY